MNQSETGSVDTQAFFHAAQTVHSYPLVLDFKETDEWIIQELYKPAI